MARIFITGSSDGIGLAAAKLLSEDGHSVYLHARSAARADQTKTACPKAKDILIADLSSISQVKELAKHVNALGPFDAIIHNAGLGYQMPHTKTAEGYASVFAVNSLAPYILTCLLDRPKRLLYMSSGLHTGGDTSLKDIAWTSGRSWSGFQAYSDSKLQNVLLALGAARKFEGVSCNAMDPGWVRTKMGGSGAPGDASRPAKVLAEYAAGEHDCAGATGAYFNVGGAARPLEAAVEVKKQQEYLKKCEELSGLSLPS